MKIVLDTNVLMSGISFTGPPYQILQAWRDGAIRLVVCPEILAEYRDVAVRLNRTYKDDTQVTHRDSHLLCGVTSSYNRWLSLRVHIMLRRNRWLSPSTVSSSRRRRPRRRTCVAIEACRHESPFDSRLRHPARR